MKLKIESSGQGPNLLLLHGWGMNSAIWSELLGTLELSFRVHRVDLPGYGYNQQQIPDQYGLEEVAEQIHRVMPDEEYSVAGWSLGGLIAITLARLFPTKVRRLVLVASNPCFVQGEEWPGMGADVLANFGLQLEKNHQRTLEQFLALQAMGSRDLKGDIRLIKEKLSQRDTPNPQALKAGLELLKMSDLRQPLAELTSPLLVILGRQDALVPRSVSQAISSLRTDAEVMTIAGASHAPFISHRSEFLSGLINWLIKK
ncbi:pimeloyl-ACP methyl ester esterase BioH [Dongshaea marina]|uniref:pimeloyl-ACP methyl ester esterase BioH n=1 Tax=Dongshaea marina TaxID=2047966 RepID=UPI000D3E49EB|nr:pimeloyl-ACP methyl ester esterase BioH [Dongshaea marina]